MLEFVYETKEVGKVTISGNDVTVKWKGKRVTLHGSKALCKEFANAHDSPGSIKSFTEKYGPVAAPPLATESDYTFTLQSWRASQQKIRGIFALSGAVSIEEGGQKLERTQHNSTQIIPGSNIEQFVFHAGKIAYEVSTLGRLVDFYISAQPPESLKLCPNPQCGKFFIEANRRKVYCGSKECKSWAHLQAVQRYNTSGNGKGK